MFFARKNKALHASPDLSFLTGWSLILKRFLPVIRRSGSAERVLEHLDSIPLGAQSSLSVVRWHDQTLLLGVTPQGISLLLQDPMREKRSVELARENSSASVKEYGR